jgi:thioesterase domain-containing protein
VAGFFHLARSLGLERPLTAFHLPSPDSGSYRLEKLAARYVREVLAAQPEGPYHLVGICTGGFVVYEMARQLSAQGKHIGVLALLDCYNHAWAARAGVLARSGYRLDLLRRRFLYQQKNLRRIGLAGVRPYLRSKLGDFFRTLMYRVRRLPIRDAAAQYVPPVWPGSLVLFRVDEPRVDAFDYPDMGWRGLAQDGIAVHEIPGGHLTMLSEPNVDLVAERLLAVLEQAENSSVRSAGHGTG